MEKASLRLRKRQSDGESASQMENASVRWRKRQSDGDSVSKMEKVSARWRKCKSDGESASQIYIYLVHNLACISGLSFLDFVTGVPFGFL